MAVTQKCWEGEHIGILPSPTFTCRWTSHRIARDRQLTTWATLVALLWLAGPWTGSTPRQTTATRLLVPLATVTAALTNLLPLDSSSERKLMRACLLSSVAASCVMDLPLMSV